MKTSTALSIENLSFSYSAKKALDQISFKICPGECTLLLGPNGAGKSTLFSLITRLYDTREGRIELCGFNIKVHKAGVNESATKADINTDIAIVIANC